MTSPQISIWKEGKTARLSFVLSSITDNNTMQAFLRDVMTESEIAEIASRLEAARMLSQGKKYREVIKETKLSSRTIARISEWLQNGGNGYSAAIDMIDSHHEHSSPAGD